MRRSVTYAPQVQDARLLFHRHGSAPVGGRRLDGGNSNYGVVERGFTPWEVLTTRMKQVNAGLEELTARPV